MTTYSGSQRRTGLAVWGAVGSLGVAAGVLLGGALTTWAGWQTIFWINAPIGAVALLLGLKVIPGAAAPRVSLNQFDLGGAATVIGSLVALIVALGATEQHGWLSARVLACLGVSAVLAVAFILPGAPSRQPARAAPHVDGEATGLRHHRHARRHRHPRRNRVPHLDLRPDRHRATPPSAPASPSCPFALAITVGTVLARHALAHAAPRLIAAVGLLLVAGGAVLLAQVSAGATFAANVLPGMAIIGLGVGMVFVPVSVTAMTGIPAQHAGMASGFLMTGHEVGAALGVAVLSAVASTAGGLATADGVVDGFPRGFLAAAAISVALAVFAYLRMPAARAEGAPMHMHH